jgi:hypothetical protein
MKAAPSYETATRVHSATSQETVNVGVYRGRINQGTVAPGSRVDNKVGASKVHPLFQSRILSYSNAPRART